MGLRALAKKLTHPVEDHHREALSEYCGHLEDVTPLDDVTPRSPTRVAGEVQVMRIVPRAGAPSLEVTVSDGHGQIVAVFYGRRRIGGVTPGRRLILEGVAAEKDGRLFIHNPVYQLLP